MVLGLGLERSTSSNPVATTGSIRKAGMILYRPLCIGAPIQLTTLGGGPMSSIKPYTLPTRPSTTPLGSNGVKSTSSPMSIRGCYWCSIPPLTKISGTGEIFHLRTPIVPSTSILGRKQAARTPHSIRDSTSFLT